VAYSVAGGIRRVYPTKARDVAVNVQVCGMSWDHALYAEQLGEIRLRQHLKVRARHGGERASPASLEMATTKAKK